MNTKLIVAFIDSIFETRENKLYTDETGITVDNVKEVKRVGYCTNLTVASIEEAHKNDVDLLITHHPMEDD